MQDPIPVKPINMQDPVTLQNSILQAGIKKSKYPWWKQIALAFQSGFYLGLVVGCCLRCAGNNIFFSSGNIGLQKCIFALLFPVGLMIIILNGFELITGNFAIYMPGLLTRQVSPQRMLCCWGLVYFGNFSGSVTAAGLFIYTAKIFQDTPWVDIIVAMATQKLELEWGVAVLRGITCNMFVVIAIYQSVMGNTVFDKVIAFWPPIFAFVALGLEHSVANMSIIPLGLFHGIEGKNWGDFFWRNLFPVTLGNFIGASFFVGILNWLCWSESPFSVKTPKPTSPTLQAQTLSQHSNNPQPPQNQGQPKEQSQGQDHIIQMQKMQEDPQSEVFFETEIMIEGKKQGDLK